MKGVFRILLLLGLVSVLVTSYVSAQQEGDADAEADPFGQEEFDQTYGATDDGVEAALTSVTRAIFPNNTDGVAPPKFHAGSPATAVVAYQNVETDQTHRVFLVVAHLQPVNNFGTILQNFSVVRQGRTVKPTETVTTQYTFTPDASFEPGEYNLVVGVFWSNTETNSSNFLAAFNGTIYIDEPLGTDPRTVLTYLTLMVIAGAVGYYFADRFGLIKMVMDSRRSNHPVRVEKRVEVGTSGSGYDPDYVSGEHLRYREEVLRRSSASPTNRKASPSPKKK